MIYTSGSTGTPKGVVVEHREHCPISPRQQFDADLPSLPNSRVLQFASPSFDAAVSEVATTLYVGATLVLPSAERVGDRSRRSHGPARCHARRLYAAVVRLLRTVCRHCRFRLWLSLAKLVRPIGEWHVGRAVGRMINELTVRPRRRLCAYRMSEDALGLRPFPDWPSVLRTIVFTFWTTVLSLFLLVLLASCTLRALGLARGYLNRAGLTAERFVADPHGVAGLADVPDRGPCAVAFGRRAGVFGPGRRAGEASRVPDRAWRDRGVAAAAGGCGCGGGDCARGCGRRRAEQRLVGYVVPQAGAALDVPQLRAGAECGASGLHGAVCVRGAGAVAADAERQARPPCAACAGGGLGAGRTVRRGRLRRRCCAGCLPGAAASSVWVSTTTSSSLAATASCRSSW